VRSGDDYNGHSGFDEIQPEVCAATPVLMRTRPTQLLMRTRPRCATQVLMRSTPRCSQSGFDENKTEVRDSGFDENMAAEVQPLRFWREQDRGAAPRSEAKKASSGTLKGM
jgi:hypothetical protein